MPDLGLSTKNIGFFMLNTSFRSVSTGTPALQASLPNQEPALVKSNSNVAILTNTPTPWLQKITKYAAYALALAAGAYALKMIYNQSFSLDPQNPEITPTPLSLDPTTPEIAPKTCSLIPKALK